MNVMKKFLGTSLFILAIPVFAYAQTFADLVGTILDVIAILVPLVIALTFLVIIWGVAKGWIINNEDTNSIEKGKQILIWGIIALIVMLSIWGIIALLRGTFFA